MSTITFQTVARTKRNLYVKIGGKRYRLDNQITYCENVIGRLRRDPNDNCGFYGVEYLEARGVIDHFIDTQEHNGQVYQYTRCRVTSLADVERCLKELTDIRDKFETTNTVEIITH
jgi:hypothetical protein